MPAQMTFEEAVVHLREQDGMREVLYDSFLDEDTAAGAERFYRSDEFEAVLRLAGQGARGTVVDVGAGTGIATFAFAKAGARLVYSVEPDPSAIVGAGAIARVVSGLPVEVLSDWGERVSLPDAVADVVYARQVLHHADDMATFVAECARLLRPGGTLIASREHVVSDSDQLEEFFASHAVHRLTGGEGAYPVSAYVEAIESAGLRVDRVLGPLDSVVNYYPLDVRKALRRKLGVLGTALSYVPPVYKWALRRLAPDAESVPGRLYTFVAVKPS
jgi:SAM-dependent methyltransferase